MNNKEFRNKILHKIVPFMGYTGKASLITLAVGTLVLNSCGRKSQAEEDLDNLKRIGYDLDQTGLFNAVENDDLSILRVFKEHKFDLLTTDHKGKSGLHVAAESGSMEALTYLLNNNAPVDAADLNGMTPLMVAARAGVSAGSNGNAEVVRYLIDKGADAQLKDKQKKFPLIHALDGGSPKVIELLAAQSRELLDTGLLYSADQNMHASIPVLVRYGASVYSRNSGKTSLMIAAERGHAEAVQVLIDEGANLYAVSDDGLLAKDFAEGDEDVMTVLLDAERSVGDDALALDWSEEELEELVQRAMERSPLVDLADSTLLQGDSSVSVKQPLGNDVVHGAITENRIAETVKNQGDAVDVKDDFEGNVVSDKLVKRIKGKKLPLDLAGEVVTKQVTMTAYAEKSLPVKVKAVDTGSVEIYDLRTRENVQNANLVVNEGSDIGVTGLRVKKITKKLVNNKLTGGEDKELVTLMVEDKSSGLSRELYAGYESQAAEAVAVLKMAEMGENLIVARNDEFYDMKDVLYRVVDVNDKEVIIENTVSGQLSLLPLMGVKR